MFLAAAPSTSSSKVNIEKSIESSSRIPSRAKSIAGALVSLCATTLLGFFPLQAAETAGASPASAAQTEPDERVLVAALKELILAPDEEQALRPQTAPAESASGVVVTGFETSAADRLKTAAAPYIGKPISKAMLARMRAAIEATPSGEAGRVYVARFPKQSISRGRVALVVSLQKDSHSELLRGADASGAPAGVVPILRTGSASRGARFFIGLDNQLSRELGDERIYAGTQLGNVFDPRSSLGVLLVATPDSDVYRGGSLNHGFRFSENWRLDVGASASEVETTNGTTTSRSTLFKLEPCVTRRFSLGSQAWHEVRLGVEWREDRTEVSQGKVSQRFPLPGFLIQPGWAAMLPDRFGRTRLDVGLNCNTGWLGNNNDYVAYGARDADYVTLRAEATRVTGLGAWGQFVLRGTAQIADQDVPSLDHFYASGMAGVRGYDENRYHGENAWFASAEHQGPRFNFFTKCSLQPVVFFDTAGFPGGGPDDNIAGAGAGVRLRAGEGFSLKLDAARAVGDRTDQDEPGVVHFSVSQRW